jgi:hypothetical protein
LYQAVSAVQKKTLKYKTRNREAGAREMSALKYVFKCLSCFGNVANIRNYKKAGKNKDFFIAEEFLLKSLAFCRLVL